MYLRKAPETLDRFQVRILIDFKSCVDDLMAFDDDALAARSASSYLPLVLLVSQEPRSTSLPRTRMPIWAKEFDSLWREGKHDAGPRDRELSLPSIR